MVPLCKSKFIRKGYLVTHLRKVHQYDKCTAKDLAKTIQSVKDMSTQGDAYEDLENISDEENFSDSAQIIYQPEVELISEDEMSLSDFIEQLSPSKSIDPQRSDFR